MFEGMCEVSDDETQVRCWSAMHGVHSQRMCVKLRGLGQDESDRQQS